jgi:hypothetical protein
LLLQAIGMQPAPASQPTLADYLAQRQAERDEAAE